MTERQLIEEIHRQYRPAKLFRNDNGTAWAGGTSARLPGGRIVLQGAKKISYGLLPGSGDLIGWTPRLITADDVGKTVAVFTSIEAKTERDSLRDDQRRWYRNVEDAGGRAVIVWEHMGEIEEFIL